MVKVSIIMPYTIDVPVYDGLEGIIKFAEQTGKNMYAKICQAALDYECTSFEIKLFYPDFRPMIYSPLTALNLEFDSVCTKLGFMNAYSRIILEQAGCVECE